MKTVNIETIPNVHLCTSEDAHGNIIQALVPFGTDEVDVFRKIEDWDSRARIVVRWSIHADSLRRLVESLNVPACIGCGCIMDGARPDYEGYCGTQCEDKHTLPPEDDVVVMSEEERILALDAAATAAERVSHEGVRTAVGLLQDELDLYFQGREEESFPSAQADAADKLAALTRQLAE